MPMMVLRILAALLLAVVAAVAVPAPVACACSCKALDTDEAMANASAVFDGEVVATSRPTSGYSAEPVEYTIDVVRVYQGSVPATVVVRSAASEASCGIELRGQMTVFGHGPAEDLRTTLCSAPVTIDRARLGAGHPPAAAPSATPAAAPSATFTPEPSTATAFDTGPLVLGSLAAALVIVGVAIWMVRRNRSSQHRTD